MDLKEIQDLIKFVAKSGVNEVELETKGVKIVIKTGTTKIETIAVQAPVPVMAAAPVAAVPAAAPATTPAPAAQAAPAAADTSKYIEVKSPMVGTFYRRPSPDKDVFVNVGDDIKKGDVVCMIEAMKLFNEIESEINGRIVKVLVDDATPIEYDQPLFLVEPA